MEMGAGMECGGGQVMLNGDEPEGAQLFRQTADTRARAATHQAGGSGRNPLRTQGPHGESGRGSGHAVA